MSVQVLLVVFISLGVWALVKQAARTFEEPEWWDAAELTAGAVGAIGFAFVYSPYIWDFDKPLVMLAYRSLIFGVGVVIVTLPMGVILEEEGWIRTPEKLAPPLVRFHAQEACIDNVDDETIEEYAGGQAA